MNVYTYYVELDSPIGLWGDEAQRKLIDVWARAWAKQGWTPIVMDESWAARHPRYAEFKEKFYSLPTEYGHQYDGACFMRYVAMAAAGGGLLTDYDVIAYDFPPVEVDPSAMTFFCGNVTTNTGCCLAPASLYEELCQLYFEWVPEARDWNPNARPPQHHCSDLSYLVQCCEGKRPRPQWMKTKKNSCVIFSQPGWETAPLVHYGYEMHAAGNWPKWEHIERLRPF